MKVLSKGSVRFVLDDEFWERASVRIKRAIRLDKMLLRSVKAEWESMRAGRESPLPTPPYPFPKPLSWLAEAWTRAVLPSNRPPKTGNYYRMSFLIERLRDFGLTHSEILDILNDPPIRDGPVKAGRKDYANIPGADLRKLSEMFWQSVGPPPDEAELWRVMNWVRRRKGSLLMRISGERMKRIKADQGIRLNGMPCPSRRPDTRGLELR